MPETPIAVKTQEALDIILADGNPKDFFIQLGECRSTKVLSRNKDGTYYCFALVDNSEETYPTMAEMLEDSNVGMAIEKGCFYYEAA